MLQVWSAGLNLRFRLNIARPAHKRVMQVGRTQLLGLRSRSTVVLKGHPVRVSQVHSLAALANLGPSVLVAKLGRSVLMGSLGQLNRDVSKVCLRSPHLELLGQGWAAISSASPMFNLGDFQAPGERSLHRSFKLKAHPRLLKQSQTTFSQPWRTLFWIVLV